MTGDEIFFGTNDENIPTPFEISPKDVTVAQAIANKSVIEFGKKQRSMD